MELIITENYIKYMENNIEYKLISNYKNEERYMGNIAAKVAKLTTAKWAEAYNIFGDIIPDYIGLYVENHEWEDDEKINNYLASYLIIKDELRKRGNKG